VGTAPKPARARAAKPPPVAEGDPPAASGATAPTRATTIRRTREAPATARLAAVEAALATLTARVAALEAAVTPPAVDLAVVKAALVTAIEDVDAATRAGGLVPIPALRAELRRRGVAARDADVDAALEALEHEWRIDLSVAQDPGQVAERAAGIQRPGRGLLYYVARR
jgi:hypothetical protein